jgi:antiviral helicase SLH1
VQISEMDGLCQETFKGYKSLNRMQSLVYPVAYKTNENMLICAPTGAVSDMILYIILSY